MELAVFSRGRRTKTHSIPRAEPIDYLAEFRIDFFLVSADNLATRILHELVHAFELTEEHNIEDLADGRADNKPIDDRAFIVEFVKNSIRFLARNPGEVVGDND